MGKIFVSYAHSDARWVDALTSHLAPYLVDRHVTVWTDRDIRAGARWTREIQAAMDQADVAILLLSHHFFGSEFIRKHELPYLLQKAEADKLRLVPIWVSPTDYEDPNLAQFQYANSKDAALSSLASREQDQSLAKLAKTIDDLFTMSALAYGLGVVDDTTEPMEARLEGRAVEEDRDYGVKAQIQRRTDEIVFSNTSMTVTIDDIEKLGPDDREYITDLEDMMGKHYERWRKLRKKLGSSLGALDDEIEDDLAQIEKRMCADLDQLLEFIERMLGGPLADHYGRYRSICARL